MSSQERKNLSPAQEAFMKNIVRPLPQKQLSESEKKEKMGVLQQLTKDRDKNALNIIHGGYIAEYKEYLQTRCNKLCSFKERTDIKPIYKQNLKVNEYINKNCQDCIKKLREFNRALDIAIENILGIDPSSPTANFNMIFILIKNGKAIFDALPLKFRKELEKFELLDSGDIKRLLNELEINLKGFIERSELARRRTNLLRRTRRGGRKTKRKKRRRKKKKRKRKRKTKKRYKN